MSCRLPRYQYVCLDSKLFVQIYLLTSPLQFLIHLFIFPIIFLFHIYHTIKSATVKISQIIFKKLVWISKDYKLWGARLHRFLNHKNASWTLTKSHKGLWYLTCLLHGCNGDILLVNVKFDNFSHYLKKLQIMRG